MIKQTVLPFKLEKTNDTITAHAGLALLGEFCVGLGLLDSVNNRLPKPGSGAGFKASEYVFPLSLMLNGGGRSLEDMRVVMPGVNSLILTYPIPPSSTLTIWQE